MYFDEFRKRAVIRLFGIRGKRASRKLPQGKVVSYAFTALTFPRARLISAVARRLVFLEVTLCQFFTSAIVLLVLSNSLKLHPVITLSCGAPPKEGAKMNKSLLRLVLRGKPLPSGKKIETAVTNTDGTVSRNRLKSFSPSHERLSVTHT